MLTLSSLILRSGAGAAAALTLPQQSPAAFETALEDRSTSPEFVAVTVVNDNSGETMSGCITASVFLGAMHKEYGLGYDPDSVDRVIAAALAEGGRAFHFRHDEAWASMPARYWSQDACDIIARGQVARMADRSGQVIAAAH